MEKKGGIKFSPNVKVTSVESNERVRVETDRFEIDLIDPLKCGVVSPCQQESGVSLEDKYGGGSKSCNAGYICK